MPPRNNEAVSRRDAEDALAYSEALLDYLYVVSKRFEAMKDRRPAHERAPLAPSDPRDL